MVLRFFLDTYAIIEIIKGNTHYVKYLDFELFTSILNLYELYYYLLREYGEEKAKEYFFQFRDMIIPIKDPHIFFAAQFKHKRKNISYADALGYAMAIEANAKFLTGDDAFQNLEHVEFIK